MLQAAKRGASSLTHLTHTNSHTRYFHSLSNVSLLSRAPPLITYTTPSPRTFFKSFSMAVKGTHRNVGTKNELNDVR